MLVIRKRVVGVPGLSRRRCGIIGLIVMSDGATRLLDQVAGLKALAASGVRRSTTQIITVTS
jgi:hypothetical protein